MSQFDPWLTPLLFWKVVLDAAQDQPASESVSQSVSGYSRLTAVPHPPTDPPVDPDHQNTLRLVLTLALSSPSPSPRLTPAPPASHGWRRSFCDGVCCSSTGLYCHSTAPGLTPGETRPSCPGHRGAVGGLQGQWRVPVYSSTLCVPSCSLSWFFFGPPCGGSPVDGVMTTSVYCRCLSSGSVGWACLPCVVEQGFPALGPQNHDRIPSPPKHSHLQLLDVSTHSRQGPTALISAVFNRGRGQG